MKLSAPLSSQVAVQFDEATLQAPLSEHPAEVRECSVIVCLVELFLHRPFAGRGFDDRTVLEMHHLRCDVLAGDCQVEATMESDEIDVKSI